MTSRIAEKTLLKPVKRFLRDQGCVFLRPELRFFDRGIDLYALAHEPDHSYAIELKVVDWQKALRQAAIYQLCADFCYVAMPIEHTTRVNLDNFRHAGVGLLGVYLGGNFVTEVLAPKASAVKNQFYSRSIQQSFESLGRRKVNAIRSS